ncbi:germin-like protein subfamily 1 member 13 [Malania oleifera]|uniref:germin-like protein subfamily 1 member 13 n=1 Tax=Malania oleifera TaxID=397392 RepID=UPI0025ADFC28|nr:germin-like protein subfamily 1 member 13 [Malania oleifera]
MGCVYHHGFLIPLLLVALAFSVASAGDPAPLQDFCVAASTTKDAVMVNGKICKDPKLVVPEDFSVSGFHKRGNTSNPLGSMITTFNVDYLPGLNTLGLSMARVDYGPGGVNPPHLHPRASEMLVVVEGTLYAGFVTTNSDSRLFSKILHKGDAFVFPVGLIHFQINIGRTPAVAFVGFGSQKAGVTTVANRIFSSQPPIMADVLSTAFQMDKEMVEHLQGISWFENAAG